MEIYLLRHGIAEDCAPGARDADRALTKEGRAKLRGVLQTAAKAGVAPALILTSPYARAVQTARIAQEILGCGGDPVLAAELTPDGDPAAVWSEIRAHRDAGQILLASHQPLLGELAAWLIGGPTSMIDVKKGSLIRIDVDTFGPHPRGVLRWLLTAKLADA